MSETVIVRQFQPEDQAAVSDLYRNSFAATYQNDAQWPELGEMTSWFIEEKLKVGGDMHDISTSFLNGEHPHKNFWVAVHTGDNKIVGCVGSIHPYNEKFNGPEYLELVRMAVDNNYRRFGVGAKLVEALAEFGRSHNCRKIYLSTLDAMVPAVRFYEKIGFVLDYQVEVFPEEMFKKSYNTGNRVHVVHLLKDL
jgi:ribosomal protein S18 acetylase RimI-like enzyme